MARSMLSAGMLFWRAVVTAVRSRGFALRSPPPRRAATVISLMNLVNCLPRRASLSAFLCLIELHLEWPDMARCPAVTTSPTASKSRKPRRTRYCARGPGIDNAPGCGAGRVGGWRSGSWAPRAAPPRARPSPPAPRDVLTGSYTVEVAALSDPDKAEHLRRVLAYRFPDAFVTPLAGTSGHYYRVRIGPYPLRTAALEHAQRVVRLGYPAIIVDERAP